MLPAPPAQLAVLTLLALMALMALLVQIRPPYLAASRIMTSRRLKGKSLMPRIGTRAFP